MAFSSILVPLFAIGQQNNSYFQHLAATHFPPGSVLAQALPRIELILNNSPHFSSWAAVASSTPLTT